MGRRLCRAGEGAALWHVLRTLIFWITGLRNTLLIGDKAIGSGMNVVGWVSVIVAVLDTIQLGRREWAAADAAPTSDGHP
jgi:hypothetical protein